MSLRSYGYPESFLQELKQKNDIVTVISRYLTLERKGGRYWARCPFHGEKTPSFSINEFDQFYYCFGCKASGNVINFVKEMESVDFSEAVRILAEWANMEIPNQNNYFDEELKKKKAEKDKLLACMKAANEFYRNKLHSKEALMGRDYLIKRSIDRDLIEKFQIGFSPNYHEIISYLKSKGFSEETQKLAGIIKEKDNSFYDALGERIIFPTINVYGEVIAFTGRTLKQKVDFAKYINTAETPLFSKGKNLFGINLVKSRKQSGPISHIIIVEGQIDTISMHKAGFDTTVASMGTALTKEQAKVLKRFTSKVFICYDGDFAGQSATLRGLDILREEGIDVRVMTLPNGIDPDDFVNRYGKHEFEKLMEQALPLIEFKLSYLLNKFNMDEIDGKAKFTEAALKVLREVESEIEREAYIEFVQSKTGASKDTLFKKLRNEKFKEIEEKQGDYKMPINLRETKHEGPFREAQQCVISNVLRNKPYAKKSRQMLNWFEEDYKEILEYILSSEPSVQEFIEQFSENNLELVGGIVNFEFLKDENSNKQLYDDCLWLIYRTHLTNKQGIILEKLKNNPSDRAELMKEMYEITQNIKNRKVNL